MTKPRPVLEYDTPGPQKPPPFNQLLAFLAGLILLGGCLLSWNVLLHHSDGLDRAELKALFKSLSFCVGSGIALGFRARFEKKGEHRKAQLVCLLPVLGLPVFLTVNGLWSRIRF